MAHDATPVERTVPVHDWAPSVNVTDCPAGTGADGPPSASLSLAPSSSRRAVTVAFEEPARMTVGPVYDNVVSSRVIVNADVPLLPAYTESPAYAAVTV